MGKKISASVKSEINVKGIEVCSSCQLPIEDRYIMRVMDHSWHETCLTCTACGILLTQTCYSRDFKLYCKADYDKLYGAKCTGCCEKISATEMVMRALDSIFHLSCFTCVGCGKQLKKGDQYVIRSGRLFCRPDFEKELAILQMSTQTSENAVVPNTNQNSPIPSGQSVGSVGSVGGGQRQDGRRGPKRPRTILTTAQRRAFKASFEVSQKPCRKVRESLAKETGLSVRIVQVWFQNQRAKLKKIQRKQQQLQQQSHQQHTTNGDSNGTGLGDKSNLDKMSPYSRLGHSGSGHLTDSSVDSPSFSVGPIQYLTHSPDGSYYSPHGDGYSKGDLGMDSETSLGGLDDVLQGNGASNGADESLSHHHHHHHQHPHHHHPGNGSIDSNGTNGPGSGGGTNGSGPSSVGSGLFGTSMTPIDKLYSMQNSYFNSSECECLGSSN